MLFNSYLINLKQIDYISINQNYVFIKNGKSRCFKVIEAIDEVVE